MTFVPKKSLGQNFLNDNKVIKIIVDTGNIGQNDFILEVGAGTGNLTEIILEQSPKKLIVIEKDQRLALYLNEKFGNRVNIFNEDMMKFEYEKYHKDKLTIFGNLPYNISTQILATLVLLEKWPPWFEILIFMFQKEVAHRILAKKNSSDFGRLAILCNWRLDIRKHFDVSKNCFYPKPKIESSILSFIPEKKNIQFKNAKNLELVTRIFFSKKRKMINKPFKQLFNNNDKDVSNKLKINLSLRPQNLSKEIYFEITKEYENLLN